MKTNTVRKSNMSKERVLALDELLPKKSSRYDDSSPGVYIRSEKDKEKELDALWQGFKVNAKEEKSPVVYLSIGFVTGAVCMLVMSILLNFGSPSKENIAELDLWNKASTKQTAAAVSVSPSVENPEPIKVKTTSYRVQSGDTLEKIAYRFYGSGTPSKIDRIQVANNLRSPHQIRAGQKLTIPLDD